MQKRDAFELHRANEARQWLAHPDRILENQRDANQRIKADIKAGHSPKCTLTKCHSECNK